MKSHIDYAKRNLHLLPQPYTSTDTARMTLVYFAVGIIKLSKQQVPNRDALVDWILSSVVDDGQSAFINYSPDIIGQNGNLAMLYSALVLLRMLDHQIEDALKQKLFNGLQSLQCKDGSFAPYLDETVDRGDLRFVYCAVASANMLGFQVDVGRTAAYMKPCQSYDGGFGQ